MPLYTQLTDSKMMIRQNPGNNEAWVYSISSNRKVRLSAISTLKLDPNLVITNVSPNATPNIIFYCHYLSYNNALPQKKIWNQLLKISCSTNKTHIKHSKSAACTQKNNYICK